MAGIGSIGRFSIGGSIIVAVVSIPGKVVLRGVNFYGITLGSDFCDSTVLGVVPSACASLVTGAAAIAELCTGESAIVGLDYGVGSMVGLCDDITGIALDDDFSCIVELEDTDGSVVALSDGNFITLADDFAGRVTLEEVPQ